ncbi:Tetratrico peptide repeat-containing protein [Actinopolyspora xinjiangensis]|uniref:Tetratrico peptide repeat-containing protein n=1 Tax=Actinopolyspora xinjiangensis TaxID=405564 RepID=A0A1H0NVJ3_9ACTN|nr:tetratricopeptide repeat protein [Actinopolyspora xinjiangensis]SDO96772.1 Tetratrico peptide repeat-containing protein [Actinopolyspora xinjiangensis]
MNLHEELDVAWQELESLSPGEFVARITKIVGSPGVPDEIREFQLACAHDSTGSPELAIPGYRRALEAGLSGYENRRAKIQLASSLRNIGQVRESVRILMAESTTEGDGLDDAVVVFLALALTDLGQEREAVSRLVHALADHLPRYTASAHRYADALNTDQAATLLEGEEDR